MDFSDQVPNQSVEKPQLPHDTAPKHKVHILVWVVLLLLLLGNVAFTIFYASSQRQISDAKQLRTSVEQKLNTTQLSLKQAQDKLKTAVFLPQDASPQCYSNNNAQMKLALINMTPIDGYNVYITNCIDDLVAGKNNSKVIAFKVNGDGSQTFVYGAGSGEPYCISGKILPASAATDISHQTGLPICKSF